MAMCVCPCACGRESSPSMILCSGCAGSVMCANRSDARAALEVATKALEEIRDLDVMGKGGCYECGRSASALAEPLVGHDGYFSCGMASRALATLRSMDGAGKETT